MGQGMGGGEGGREGREWGGAEGMERGEESGGCIHVTFHTILNCVNYCYYSHRSSAAFIVDDTGPTGSRPICCLM